MYPISYEADFNPTPNRWTTFFRLLLAIPWFIVATFWLILFAFTHLFAWVAVVILGRYPQWLYEFNSGVVRFSIRTSAWIYLQTDVWPPFSLSDDPSYPIRVNFAPAGRAPEPAQGLLPHHPRAAGGCWSLSYGTTYIQQLAALVAWLTIVFRGYLPEGDQQHADLRQQLPRPRLRLPGDPHRRLPADRARAGQGRQRPGRSPCPSSAARSAGDA